MRRESGAQTDSPTVPVGTGVLAAMSDTMVGASLGRYVVIERIGSGGMGVVYRAYDPKLEREVALKLLRMSMNEGASQGRSRLLREAQAMAQLSHPNVMPVYDVEAVGDRLFIAMEFVRGKTLREVIASGGLAWREMLRIFVQAGRGLAAAHDRGLVHRDFKPANVVVGEDGRVRVMDFGLARAAGEPVELEAAIAPVDTEPRAVVSGRLSAPLTEAGIVMGTPAYMAPEQHAARPGDARSDQFGFCVALFEGLHRFRPFDGPDVRDLVAQKKSGDIVDTTGSSVPGWVSRALLRGLAADPDARWPSMQTLLVELERDPAQARRRWLVGVGGVGLAAAAAYGLIGREDAACSGAERELEGVWDAQRKAALGAAFEATQVPYAADAWRRVQAVVDERAAVWVAARTEACRATAVRKEQSTQMLDRRMACLDQWTGRVAALGRVWADADAVAVRHAVESVSKLPGVDRCADREYLLSAVAPPADSDIAQRVEAVRKQVGDAQAALDAGHFDRALSLAEQALADAKDTAYRPLEAEAWSVFGFAHDAKGTYEAAAVAFRRAYFAALASGHDEVGVRAAGKVVFVLASRQAKPDEAMAWTEHGKATLERFGDDPALEARLLQAISTAYNKRGDLDEAAELLSRSLELREQHFGPDHLEVSFASAALGSIRRQQGDYEGAVQLLERALKIRTFVQGPDHPDIAIARNNVANSLAALARHEEAFAHYEGALAIFERAHAGRDHPDIAMALHNLGGAYLQQGKFAEAIPFVERALAIREQTLGPEHPEVGGSLMNLGGAYFNVGEYEKSERYHRKALAVFEAALPEDHPWMAMALNNLAADLQRGGDLQGALDLYTRAEPLMARLGKDHRDVGTVIHSAGEVHLQLGHVDKALDSFRRALTKFESSVGPDHPLTVVALTSIGEALLAKKDRLEATEVLERALEICDKGATPLGRAAGVRFLLARALGRKDPRAKPLATQALADYSEAGDGHEVAKALVENWLRGG